MKRRAIFGSSIASLVVAALACGEIPPPPAGIAPMNTCQQQSDCEQLLTGATCTKDGLCAAPGKLSYTLVVTLPTTSNYAPGETIFLPPAYLNTLFAKQKVPGSCKDQDPAPACNCIAPKCLFLPLNGEQQGTLKVSRAVAAEQWPWRGCASSALSQTDKDKVCGLRPFDPNRTYTSLPARVVFRPLWQVDTNFDFASSVGVPMQDIVAKPSMRPSLDPGPNNTTGTQFDVLLQRGDMDTGVGWYVRRADPPPPFDSAFPPMLQRLQVTGVQGSPTFENIQLDALDPNAMQRTFLFKTDGPDLTGWRVYLAARRVAKSFDFPVVERERLSTVTTIASPTGETVMLQTGLAVNTLAGMYLVAEPPTGQALPTFAIEDVSGQISPAEQTIPALPAPVQVSGATTLEGRGRQSHVTFESQPDGIELANGKFSGALAYRTTVDTDATGAYSVHLPPGKYNAYVLPFAADSAKTMLPFPVGSKDPIQQGRALALRPKTHVHAVVALGDDRPVGGAEVMFFPTNPEKQPMGTNALSLPRPALTHTVISGKEAVFDIDVDPGVYDITIAPLAGTKFPWLLRTSAMIPATSDLQLDPFTIVPPLQQGGVVPGLTLRGPSGNAIVGAMVEVYASPEVAPTSPSYVNLVGRVMTDSNGHFDLHLAGTPNK